MSDRESLFQLVLQVYPPAFRRSFGGEMLSVYRAQRRDGVVDARYWVASIADAMATAPRLWTDELHESFLAATRGTKAMGILSIVTGLLEAANSLVELRASTFGEPDSQSMLMLVIASGLLLTVAGWALLFRGQSARRLGWIGALTGLGSFSLMLATRPMMSIAATGLGMMFPLGLAVYLYRSSADAASRATPDWARR